MSINVSVNPSAQDKFHNSDISLMIYTIHLLHLKVKPFPSDYRNLI